MNAVRSIERQWSFRLGNLGFITVLIALAAVGAWPIYQSPWFLGVVGFSIIAAVAAVFAVWGKAQAAWLLTAVLLLLYVVFGVLIAYPELYQSPQELLPIWVDALRSGVTGWKDLVTITLPVGNYRGLLVPALVVFLFGSGYAYATGLRARNTVGIAVTILSLMMLFGLIFGAGHGEGLIQLFGFRVLGMRELLLGALFFLITVFWLAWRSYAFRHAALSRAQTTSGVVLKKTLMTRASRLMLGLGMLAIALTLATLVTPPLMAERSREVLRTNIDPEILLAQTLSPLAGYRDYQLNEYDTELFRIESVGELPERIRLATLSLYDGQSFRVAGTQGAATSGEFIRIPYRLAVPAGAIEYDYQVQLVNHDDIWLPIAGALTWIEFLGAERSALADGFYYQPELHTAVNLSGVTAAAQFRVHSAVSQTPELSTLEPLSRTSINNPQIVPESLVDWLELQEVPRNGAGLGVLVDRLRARGYLSHSLSGTSDDEAAYDWIGSLPDYDFMPSLAGHNTDRIGDLFEQLLAKENRVDASADENLVAAIGDDEQFSVAVALLAGELGFDARVVVGAYLQNNGGQEYRVPACDFGVCRGQNIASWVEVRGTSGQWVPIDVTPQFDQVPVEDEDLLQDPKNTTNVDADKPSVILPQQNLPEAGEQQQQADDDPLTGAVASIWGILAQIGLWSLAVLLILAPLLVVLLAKFIRRMLRNRAAQPALKIAGGWDEYLDQATDLGAELPWNSTRIETAQQLAGPHSATLAQWADFSQYAAPEQGAPAAEEYWKMMREDLRQQRAPLSWWQKIAAMFSVKSFTRHLESSVAKTKTAQRARKTGGGRIGITLATQSVQLGRKTRR